MPVKNLTAGVNNHDFYNKIKVRVSTLDHEARQCILIFDEISIKKDLKYNQHHNKVDGFVDYGEGEIIDNRQNIIAKSICVFMIRSLFGSFKQVLSYVVVEKSTSPANLKYLVEANLDICTELGLDIKVTVCDQGPTNQSLYRLLGTNEKKPYFYFRKSKIYALFNVPHIFNNIRNNLMKYKLSISDCDTKVNWDVIKELFLLDTSSKARVCPRLKPEHINPNNFQRMNVRLAVQILSKSTTVF